jgi:trk system potassium uptake protein TrkH
MERKFKFKMPAAAIVALSFLVAIAVGTAFLCIPAAISDGEVNFMTALFTATSATCVTGLSVVDSFNHWSYFGQAIILILIQAGGLGFVTIISIFLLNVKKRPSLSQRKLVMQSAGSVNLEGIRSLIKYILIGTFIFEFLGAFLLCFSFVPKMGWGQGIWQAIFTSVSAFCNAGFTLTDKFGESSLMGYVSDPLVNIVICLLIIIGGIGFFIWGDVVKYNIHFKKYSFHSKIVLSTTGILILSGWVLFAVFEWNNPATIGDYGVGTKILASLFMAVSPRTAGFNTVDIASLSNSGSLLTMIYMFIGGSPGSTAGGIKTTTIAVFFLSSIATAKRYDETHAFKRRFEDDAYHQAGVVIGLYFTLIIISVLIIGAVERESGFSLLALLFEVISAVGTVGLSYGNITPGLSIISQLIIVALMYCGRVGGFTLILIFSNEKKPVTISRVADKLIIG